MPKQSKKTKSVSKKTPPRRLQSSVRSIAPVAIEYQPPKSAFSSRAPRRGCAGYQGCDFVGTISSTTSLQATSFGILNPLNAAVFPRLSTVALNFRRYRYEALRFHLFGRSASTQKGVIGFSSMIDDFRDADVDVNTEARVKNMQNCTVLRGWESGVHHVDVQAQGPNWYSCDNAEPNGFNNTNPGCTYFTIPATTAAGDLQWDLYVEYSIDFDISVLQAVNTFRDSPGGGRQATTPPSDTEELTLSRLRARVRELTIAPNPPKSG